MLKKKRCLLREWARKHADSNVVRVGGKLVKTERDFRAAGLHKRASPTFEQWQRRQKVRQMTGRHP